MCCALLFSALSPAQLAPVARKHETTEVPVLWLIGQSNAEGATAGFWLANPFSPGNAWPHLASQSGVRIWWPGRSTLRPNSIPGFEAYRVGSIQPQNNGSRYIVEDVFGPEAALGSAANTHFGEPVWVFKHTVIATLDPSRPPTFSKTTATTGPYRDMFVEWAKARRWFAERDLVPVIKGIFFVVGEHDLWAPGPDPELFARNFGVNLARWITDVRTDLASNPGPHPIPVVLSQVHDRHVPRDTYQSAEILMRAGQAQVAQQVAAVALTSTDGLSLYPNLNQNHFDAVGSMQLGFRLFQSLRPLLR